MPRARLFLITPRSLDLEAFVPQLEAALDGGDVASLLIATEVSSEAALQRIAERLVPIAQSRDVAVMVRGDSRTAGRSKADGIHCDTGAADLASAIEAFHPKSIVGAAGLKSRDEAMAAGEAGADYLFFGMIDLPEEPAPHRKSIDFGRWWANVFEPPCVVLAGADLASVTAAAGTGAEFVALRDAVWTHPDGPAAAVKIANDLLEAAAVSQDDEDPDAGDQDDEDSDDGDLDGDLDDGDQHDEGKAG
ncbi:thiamine phosphate synthase [Methylobrevis pamukkalensis]|uniref:Thiamine-phosphate pyrophosphorylase n=1 Tax=Methylobrevis pamukkalensis TaxID=1439726 RepID=A0A1E3H2K9_9HYPH|nr:thiamine phosphate synthase [Methylobrevis pamukkalensis]ODN70036.1 thiamine-phosphate pyrophosphorylase [Methylobrevis pamukkalensis]